MVGRNPIIELTEYEKILFVEDNQALLELYGVLLADKHDHWQITLAPDGETALTLLRRTEFNVVVTDMLMPGMNGIELLAKVRDIHPQTSRVIISGFIDQVVAAESLKCTHQFLPQ